MKKIASFTAILLLAACANNNPSSSTQNHTNHTNQASASFQRSFECNNGFTVQTSQPSQTLTLSVQHGEPAPATVVLNRTSEGNYGANTGLFGGGAQWSESGNNARFVYATPTGRMATINCSR